MKNRENFMYIDELYADLIKRKKQGYITDYNTAAEIFNFITYFEYSVEWLEKIKNLSFSEEDLQSAREEEIKKFNRTKHIMSIGDEWNDDEWMLVLLFRLELEMVKDFFHFRGFDFPSDEEMDLKELCEEMKELSQTKKNKQVFEGCVRQMQKNSPLPFVDIWFEADHRDEYLRK